MSVQPSEYANNHGTPYTLSPFAQNNDKPPGLSSFASAYPDYLTPYASNTGPYKPSSFVEKHCAVAHAGHSRPGPDPTKAWPIGVDSIVLAARSRLLSSPSNIKNLSEDTASYFTFALLAHSLRSDAFAPTPREIEAGFLYLRQDFGCSCNDHWSFRTLLKCVYSDKRVWKPLWEGARVMGFNIALQEALDARLKELEGKSGFWGRRGREREMEGIQGLLTRLKGRRYYGDGTEMGV